MRRATRQASCMSKPDTRLSAEQRYAQLPVAVQTILEAARSKKALDLVVLDLRHSSAFTDFFVICSAHSTRQLAAIANAVADAMALAGQRPSHVEGYGRAKWVVLDFFDIVVHVFTPDMREFYGLERLWGDADRLELEDEKTAH